MNTIWNGKRKAVTLSYDDGVLQDKRLVKLFDQYSLRATFNINSGMLYNECIWRTKGIDVVRMNADELLLHLSHHEIAGHGLTHTDLRTDNDYQAERQIVGDKMNLERIFQRKIYGFAYPGGHGSKYAKAICNKFGIKYARTSGESMSFDIPDDLLEFAGTIHHSNRDFLPLVEKFLNLRTNKPQLLYVWGHSFELDIDQNWDVMEEFCRMISRRKDIFYGTNHEVLSPFYK